jgi:glycosyltransferase involved in cell wall biosynthesis
MAMAPRARIRIQVREAEGITVVQTPDLLWGPLRSGWDPWEILRRSAWLRGRDFDLVHAFETRPTVLLPALALCRAHQIPLILDWGDWFGRGGSVEERSNALLRAVLRPVETFFEERFRRRAEATTVICSTLRERAIALGVPHDTITLLPDGADVDGLRPLDRDRCRRELGLPPGVPMIGYVGAIFPRDAALMARAFDRVYEALPSARLLLAGYVNRPIASMVAAPRAVLSTGFVSYADLNRYLCACDLCWLPLCDSGANRGRWPMKLNDYMAAGRPTVATAVGDVTGVMEKYEIGLLAGGTARDLAQQALALISHPERCRQLGANARRVAEEVFPWRLMGKRLEGVYDRVLSSRNGELSLPDGAGFRPGRRG